MKTTFDKAATIYDVRPSYPEAVIEEIIGLSGIAKRGIVKQVRILEVGVGTGQITLPFAKRGYPIAGKELHLSMINSFLRSQTALHLVKVINGTNIY
ncbi:MAG: class I SAM-dependent methyltransferase [Trueperaceae bacterium]